MVNNDSICMYWHDWQDRNGETPLHISINSGCGCEMTGALSSQANLLVADQEYIRIVRYDIHYMQLKLNCSLRFYGAPTDIPITLN